MTQADFLRTPFPEPQDLPEGVPQNGARFFNREISWLSFNWRVLDESVSRACANLCGKGTPPPRTTG